MGHFVKAGLMRKLCYWIDRDLASTREALTVAVRLVEWNALTQPVDFLSIKFACAPIANSEYHLRFNYLAAECNMVAFLLGADYATRDFSSALFQFHRIKAARSKHTNNVPPTWEQRQVRFWIRLIA